MPPASPGTLCTLPAVLAALKVSALPAARFEVSRTEPPQCGQSRTCWWVLPPGTLCPLHAAHAALRARAGHAQGHHGGAHWVSACWASCACSQLSSWWLPPQRHAGPHTLGGVDQLWARLGLGFRVQGQIEATLLGECYPEPTIVAETACWAAQEEAKALSRVLGHISLDMRLQAAPAWQAASSSPGPCSRRVDAHVV